jgi:hypothetical protein
MVSYTTNIISQCFDRILDQKTAVKLSKRKKSTITIIIIPELDEHKILA